MTFSSRVSSDRLRYDQKCQGQGVKIRDGRETGNKGIFLIGLNIDMTAVISIDIDMTAVISIDTDMTAVISIDTDMTAVISIDIEDCCDFYRH